MFDRTIIICINETFVGRTINELMKRVLDVPEMSSQNAFRACHKRVQETCFGRTGSIVSLADGDDESAFEDTKLWWREPQPGLPGSAATTGRLLTRMREGSPPRERGGYSGSTVKWSFLLTSGVGNEALLLAHGARSYRIYGSMKLIIIIIIIATTTATTMSRVTQYLH